VHPIRKYSIIKNMSLTVIECCTGGGGQAIGLEMAGFDCVGAIEIDPDCCATLRLNRPQWPVLQADMRHVDGRQWEGADLFAAGVPCPPFSVAGKQLGADDDRDMFPSALRLIAEIRPRAVLLENVPGFAAAKFSDYRKNLIVLLEKLGYEADWRILEAADFGVAQLRPRFLLVAMKPEHMRHFFWPEPSDKKETVGKTLLDLMSANKWMGAKAWAKKAAAIAPTVVGGSKKHGGPDLGPTRAKACWQNLYVDGKGIAAEAPDKEKPLDFMPRLTVRMVARIQSFPDTWIFHGKKTAAYRQVGNAFPPLVAKAIGEAIRDALNQKVYPVATPSAFVQLRLLERADKTKAKKSKRKKKT
jgi:DNA (cytosine-5)-methyltransferase 1